jgi:hypothetical protein
MSDSIASHWRSVDQEYPELNVRILIAADGGEVGIGYWDPDGGWLIEFDDGITEVEPLFWMPIPEHPVAKLRGLANQ